MTKHKTGTREQWLAARLELLKAEKELTRQSDELARRRQELPWVRIDKEYRFQTDEGSASLADLFRGHSQLLVYHFMFGPDYHTYSPMRADWTASGASTNGSTAHPRGATRRASGCAATTSTTSAERSCGCRGATARLKISRRMESEQASEAFPAQHRCTVHGVSQSSKRRPGIFWKSAVLFVTSVRL